MFKRKQSIKEPGFSAACLKEGFKGVVNLRESGEPNQVLSPEAEGVKVQGLGMEYLHFSVSVRSLTGDRVDDFCSQLTALPRPVLVHCGTGMRAGALCMIAWALKNGCPVMKS